MNIDGLLLIMVVSAIIFVMPVKLKWHCAFALQLLFAAITGWAAFQTLINDSGVLDIPFLDIAGSPIHLVMDKLSAFFVLVVNFTALTGGMYALGYLKP